MNSGGKDGYDIWIIIICSITATQRTTKTTIIITITYHFTQIHRTSSIVCKQITVMTTEQNNFRNVYEMVFKTNKE